MANIRDYLFQLGLMTISVVLGWLGTRMHEKWQKFLVIIFSGISCLIAIIWVGLEIYASGYVNGTVEAEARFSATQTEAVKRFDVTLAYVHQVDSTPSMQASATSSYSSAVVAVMNFYDGINNAETPDELYGAWDIETSGANGLQCRNATSSCIFPNFRDSWWPWKVDYEMYDCGSNVVDVELRRYRRDPLIATTPKSAEYWRHELVLINGQLKINRIYGRAAPGDVCVFVVSEP